MFWNKVNTKLRNVLSMLAFFIVLPSSYAQDSTNAKIDSLIVSLMNDSKDSIKVNTYNQLAEEYLNIDVNQSAEYARMAKKMALEINYAKGLMFACMKIGFIEMSYFLNYNEAENNLSEALDIANSLNDKESLVLIYKWLSFVSSSTKNYQASLDFNEKAESIAKELNNDIVLSELYAYKGGVYEEMGDTSMAISVYKEVFEIEKKNNFRETSSAARIVIARLYLLQDDFENALKYYRIAIKTFERANDFRWLSYTHSEMAALHILDKNLEQAEQHGLKGLEIAETNNLLKEQADNCRVLVKVYDALDSNALSKKYQDKLSLLDVNTNLSIQAPVIVDESTVENQSSKKENQLFRVLMSLILVLPVILIWIIIKPNGKAH